MATAMYSGRGKEFRRTLDMAESSPKVRDRMRLAQRRLKEELADLERREHQSMRHYNTELAKIRFQLEVGRKKVSTPLDQMRIPSLKFAQMGFAYAATLQRRNRMRSAPPMTFRSVETPPPLTFRKEKKEKKEDSFWNRRASMFVIACGSAHRE